MSGLIEVFNNMAVLVRDGSTAHLSRMVNNGTAAIVRFSDLKSVVKSNIP
ncbi:hypothetical protein [Pontibacillus sp. HMF3514]|nr:hypothetical protein [Pontibacillus sp. HMF3514]QHE52263.1 hypothetical protein GS400_09555 [Pontibacillus sp. HMF3514]